jgi:NADH-quinone oxidoreductase subunit H
MSADPLFAHGFNLAVMLIVLLKVVLTFVFLLLAVLLYIWCERKFVSDLQNRIGPDRAGPHGILQSLADGIKVFFKEAFVPAEADSRIYKLAPYLATIPAFVSFAIIPIGGEISIAGHHTYLQLADPPIGVLFLLAMSSIAVYGVFLAGWSSGSKYPLLGSVRASAQMISYEAAMSIAVATAVLQTGSLSTHRIFTNQFQWHWNLWQLGVVPFLIYIVAATAEVNRPPFDLVEAEQELVGGYMTEYAGVRFALYYLAEFMNTITVSAVAVTLFLGGPSGPHINVLPALWPVVWFFLKLFVFVSAYVWLRATLPRLRYDQLMDLGWKRLIPLSLYWLLLVAALQIGRQEHWPWGVDHGAANAATVVAVAVGAGIVVFGGLGAAIRVGQRRVEEETAEAGGIRV